MCATACAPRERTHPPLVVMLIDIAEARAVFDRRVAAWLAEDVDAYVDVLARRHADRDADRRDRRRGALPQARGRQLRVGRAGVVRRAPPRGRRRRTTSCFADWTIRARRREDDVLVEWRGLSVCELGTAGSAGGASIIWRRRARSSRADRRRAGYRWVVSSTASTKRSTASLKAFGASAIRPCAAPRNT